MSELVKPIEGVEKLVATNMSTSEKKPLLAYLLPMGVAAVILGVGAGYFLSSKLAIKPMVQPQQQEGKSAVGDKAVGAKVKVGMVFGDKDASAFPDVAEGVLVSGGKEGEGSHHLLREGGESQSVYLTSSAINLDDFLNQKVTVRGQTNSAQKAGWLLDVGQLRVDELNPQLPAWAQKHLEKSNMKSTEN